MYTFLESLESWLVLKPQNGLFSRPWLHQGLSSWITWSYRSRYPTSMTWLVVRAVVIWLESWRFMHCIIHHLLEWHQFETWGFSQDIKIMSQKLFVRCRLTTELWQARLEKWSKEINSEQQSLQEWCATTLEWKFESNGTSIDKDMLRDIPWHDGTALILYVPPKWQAIQAQWAHVDHRFFFTQPFITCGGLRPAPTNLFENHCQSWKMTICGQVDYMCEVTLSISHPTQQERSAQPQIVAREVRCDLVIRLGVSAALALLDARKALLHSHLRHLSGNCGRCCLGGLAVATLRASWGARQAQQRCQLILDKRPEKTGISVERIWKKTACHAATSCLPPLFPSPTFSLQYKEGRFGVEPCWFERWQPAWCQHVACETLLQATCRRKCLSSIWTMAAESDCARPHRKATCRKRFWNSGASDR